MKVLSKEEYIHNTAYVLPHCKNISNADMNKLAEIQRAALGIFKIRKIILRR